MYYDHYHGGHWFARSLRDECLIVILVLLARVEYNYLNLVPVVTFQTSSNYRSRAPSWAFFVLVRQCVHIFDGGSVFRPGNIQKVCSGKQANTKLIYQTISPRCLWNISLRPRWKWVRQNMSKKTARCAMMLDHSSFFHKFFIINTIWCPVLKIFCCRNTNRHPNLFAWSKSTDFRIF